MTYTGGEKNVDVKKLHKPYEMQNLGREVLSLEIFHFVHQMSHVSSPLQKVMFIF